MGNSNQNNQPDASDDEIKFLMTEHLEYSKQTNGIVKFAATVTGALLALAFSAQTPDGYLIALSPLLVLWPLHSLAMNRNCNMIRIATYIRAFSGPDWQYEERLNKFRKKMDETKNNQGGAPNKDEQKPGVRLKKFWARYEFANNGIFIMLGFLSVACAFLLKVKQLAAPPESIQVWNWFRPLLIPLMSGIAWLIYWLRKKRVMQQGGMGRELEDQCFALWEEIRSEK
jgi:hypothetical protein